MPKPGIQDVNISKQCFSNSNSVLNVQISSHPYLENVAIYIKGKESKIKQKKKPKETKKQTNKQKQHQKRLKLDISR